MWTPRRVLLLIFGVAVFGMAFGIYSRFLGWIDGLPQLPGELLARRADNDPFAPPKQTVTQRKLLLAFGPNCNELTYNFMIELPSKGIVIAYNQHDFEPDGRIRLSPFSLATLKERTLGSCPEINSIHCDVGYLEFDKPVKNFQEIGSRRIVACELVGDPALMSHDPRRGSIHLNNNRGTPAADDDLTMVTSGPVSYRESSTPGMALDKARPEIWTKAAVHIVDKRNQPQSTSVTAQGMQVFLAVEPPTSDAKKRAMTKRAMAITGVRRVVMPENVNMSLWMESGSGFLASSQPKPANPGPAERTNLLITTLGPFTYDVLPDGDRARFDRLPPAATPLPNCVRVVRPQQRGPDAVLNDQLECDHLELQFTHKTVPTIAATGKPATPARNRAEPDRPSIEWVHAWGQFVVLTSDEERLEARGNDLFHDVAAKKTTLRGNPHTIALKDGNEIYAPELVLHGADANQTQHAEARGVGFVRVLDRSGTKRTMHARWRDRLVYRKENGQDLLTLAGDAVFEDTASGQVLRGDTLKLLLAPDPRTAGAKPAPDAPAPRPRPQRLEAFGNVSARSAEIVMHDVEELILLFRDVAPTASSMGATKTTLPAANVPTANPPARNASETGAKPSPPRQPIDLRARRIQAFVNVGPGDVSQIDNVHCEDNVHVHQDPVAPQTKPIDLDGQTLNLRHTPEGNILEVTGSLQAPGEVILPDLTLRGPHIKIDQIENVAEVIGIGMMTMESQTDLQGKKLDRPTPLTVLWKQKMRFNGQVALFHGHVQADQDATSLLCNNMQVFLNRPVSLNPQSGAARGPNQSAANVDKVICDNQGQALPQNVSITESVYGPAGKLLRYQRIECTEVALHKEEGSMDAGPGSVRILQPGPKDSVNQLAAGKPGIKPVGNQKAEEEYKLTWVRYGQKLRVDNLQRTASFYKNVEVLHLPKDDPGLQLEFSKIVDKLPQGAVHLKCEKLIVYSSKDAAGHTSQEFTANGRAEVQAAEFSGRADVIKFNEAKNLVIFEGSEGSLAELNRILVRGQEPETIKAEKITYNRQTGEFETKGTRIIKTGGKR